VIYSMSVSLDRYIAGPDGRFDWTTPDEEAFRFWTDQTRELAAPRDQRGLLLALLGQQAMRRLRAARGETTAAAAISRSASA
jgi:hypothetical protein